mmetsp:Transcript_33652/g.54772  ORF Transcript_33652/g.54772 Transcript_33652/m.54772 type:complete len:474 (-) Transcript_33652:67-1488(-)
MHNLFIIIIGFFIRGLLRQHIQVILLQESQILSGLGKLALFHTLTDIPMHKRALRIHQVVLLADALAKHSRDGGIVSNHHHVALGRRQIILRQHRRWLLIETDLEASRAPLHKRRLLVRLQPLHRRVRLFRLHIATIIHRNSHIFVLFRIKISNLGKKVARRETRLRDGLHIILLRFRFLRCHHRRHRRNHEMQTREGHQVGLELVEVHIQFALETQRRRHRRNHFGDQSVQVVVRRSFAIQPFLANLVNRFVVQHHRDLSVVQQPMRGQQRVVRLHHTRRNGRRRIHFKAQLRLLAIIHGDALQNQGTQTGASTTADRMRQRKPLHIVAVVHQFAQAIVDLVDHLFAHRVMATCEIVRRIFLARQQELRVEDLGVLAVLDVVNHIRLQIHHQVARHILTGASLLIETHERHVLHFTFLLAIDANRVLGAILLPHSLTQLDTALSHVHCQHFSHHFLNYLSSCFCNMRCKTKR